MPLCCQGGYHWLTVGVVANNSKVVTHEGANENDLVLTRDGSLLAVLRVDAGDGEGCVGCDSASSGCRGPASPFHRAISRDLGRTWSEPTPLPLTSNTRRAIGSVRPRMAALGTADAPGPIVLVGGRNAANNGMRCGMAALPVMWPLAQAIRDGKCAGECPMTVLCPPGCADSHGPVWGTGPFTMSSDVCAAAIFAGAIRSAAGGWIQLSPTPKPVRSFGGGERHGVAAQAHGPEDSNGSRGHGLLIANATGPRTCTKLWENFGCLDFKELGMKLWVSEDGTGEDWIERDLSHEHNLRAPAHLQFDERVNASVGGHGGWATQSYFSLQRLTPTSALVAVK